MSGMLLTFQHGKSQFPMIDRNKKVWVLFSLTDQHALWYHNIPQPHKKSVFRWRADGARLPCAWLLGLRVTARFMTEVDGIPVEWETFREEEVDLSAKVALEALNPALWQNPALQDPVTIAELLDEGDTLLQEFRSGNEQLLERLCTPDNLRSLVEHATQPQSQGVPEERLRHRSHTAAELLAMCGQGSGQGWPVETAPVESLHWEWQQPLGFLVGIPAGHSGGSIAFKLECAGGLLLQCGHGSSSSLPERGGQLPSHPRGCGFFEFHFLLGNQVHRRTVCDLDLPYRCRGGTPLPSRRLDDSLGAAIFRFASWWGWCKWELGTGHQHVALSGLFHPRPDPFPSCGDSANVIFSSHWNLVGQSDQPEISSGSFRDVHHHFAFLWPFAQSDVANQGAQFVKNPSKRRHIASLRWWRLTALGFRKHVELWYSLCPRSCHDCAMRFLASTKWRRICHPHLRQPHVLKPCLKPPRCYWRWKMKNFFIRRRGIDSMHWNRQM